MLPPGFFLVCYHLAFPCLLRLESIDKTRIRQMDVIVDWRICRTSIADSDKTSVAATLASDDIDAARRPIIFTHQRDNLSWNTIRKQMDDIE